MGKFRVEIKELAKKQIIQHYKSGDKKSIKNIEKILLELSETPFEGIGNPEPLKYELTGFWSRRINQKDRIIYYLEDEIVTIFVVSAKGHYSDK
ncbi:Txe/YoeB family addiction module toxin [Flavobacterium anhuiense]|jgi:toxin YoeB|uniref:Txe/YoeB family addiction module toxin n=1 Tax=Flavobacterium anhuiense TaxID=459526 RepID=UPI0034D9773C